MKFKRNVDRIERSGRSRFFIIGMAVICLFMLFWMNTDSLFVRQRTIKVVCIDKGVYTINNDTTFYKDFASKMIELVKEGKEQGVSSNVQFVLGNYREDTYFVDVLMVLNALNITYRLIH